MLVVQELASRIDYEGVRRLLEQMNNLELEKRTMEARLWRKEYLRMMRRMNKANKAMRQELDLCVQCLEAPQHQATGSHEGSKHVLETCEEHEPAYEGPMPP